MKFDMKKMMAEVARVQEQMQERVKEAQAKLRETTVVGSAGGGLVEVEMNGERELVRVTIKPEALASLSEGANAEEAVEELSDLVFAAVNSALAQATKLNEELMGEVTGGMNLGELGLPNLPFGM